MGNRLTPRCDPARMRPSCRRPRGRGKVRDTCGGIRHFGVSTVPSGLFTRPKESKTAMVGRIIRTGSRVMWENQGGPPPVAEIAWLNGGLATASGSEGSQPSLARRTRLCLT